MALLFEGIRFRRSGFTIRRYAPTSIHSGADDGDNMASSDDIKGNAVQEIDDSSDNESNLPARKRAAPKGRGRGATQSSNFGDWLRFDRREDDLGGRPGSIVQTYAARGGLSSSSLQTSSFQMKPVECVIFSDYGTDLG